MPHTNQKRMLGYNEVIFQIENLYKTGMSDDMILDKITRNYTIPTRIDLVKLIHEVLYEGNLTTDEDE